MATDRFNRCLAIANKHSSQFAELGQQAIDLLHRHFKVVLVHNCDDGSLTDVDHQYGAVDLIFVLGGDGTVHGLLPALLKADTPVCVVPMGTANDLARGLGIPDQPLTAIKLLLQGDPKYIDVGVVNGHLFINVASVGIGAFVASRMDDLEKKYGKLLSYALGLYRAWRDAQPIKVRLTLDGKVHEQRVLQLGVGNGRYHGGGIAVSETAELTDGNFDVYCVAASGLVKLIADLASLWMQAHHTSKSIRTFKAKEVLLETVPACDVNADGELVTRTPARFWMHDKQLQVLVPHPADGDDVAL